MEPTPNILPNRLLLKGAALVAAELRDHPISVDPAVPGIDPRLDLFAGPLGLALFWAALARVHPGADPTATERCLAALEPARRLLADGPPKAAATEDWQPGIGGLYGLGALVHTLVSVADLLGAPRWLDDAAIAASWITPRRIVRDEQYEVLFGSAGALLALLALARRLPEGRTRDGVLARAEVCGRHLVDRRRPTHGGCRAWPFQGRFHSGFPHGAAGIAAALARLHPMAPRGPWRDAAREALAFERQLDRPEGPGWLFHAEAAGERHIDTWCRGAPSILLGRLVGGDGLDGPEVREDIRRTLERSRQLATTRGDDLCCGSMGRALVLFEAHGWLATQGERQTAEEVAREIGGIVRGILGRAKGRDGRFASSKGRRGDRPSPFFFQGAAGIGYALLYFATAGDLPAPWALAPAI